MWLFIVKVIVYFKLRTPLYKGQILILLPNDVAKSQKGLQHALLEQSVVNNSVEFLCLRMNNYKNIIKLIDEITIVMGLI